MAMTEPFLAPPGSFHPRNGAILTSGILLALSGLGSLGSGAMSVVQVFLMKRIGSLGPKSAAELGEVGASMWTISLANLVFYGLIGILFLYAAIGCFTYRRWARPMNLTLGWGWLYMGVVMMMGLVVMMGPMREAMSGAMTKATATTSGGAPPPPVPIDGILGIVMVVYLLIIVVFVIVPPALILWLNWSQDVRHTLEWRDRVPRWTDRLPVALSGLVIASALFAIISIPGVFLMNEPWMASVLGDGPVKYAWWIVPVAWAYVAWGTLRRQIAAWFTAMISLLNFILLEGLGAWTGLNERIAAASDGRYEGLSLQLMLGLLLAPAAWLMGVPSGDLMVIGQLLGERTVLNEFYAYVSFSKLKDAGLIVNEKSILIATYALCGFANFASIGIQVGGIGALAPGQRHMLARMGLRAMIAGTLACIMTACIAGMLI